MQATAFSLICHIRNQLRRSLLWLTLGVLVFSPLQALAGNSAVIFMYHRFGEDDFPSTSIKMEQFEAHLTELKGGGYTVMSLEDIIKAFKDGSELPDKAVALTIDDAYLSVYEKAWPRFKDLGFPFTVFVSSDPVDRGIRGYMSWNQIREMDRDGASIGNHTVTHLNMAASDISLNRRELDESSERLLKELGYKPDLIAYPYGEASEQIMNMVRSSGFIAGFGQHSGVAAKTPDMFYLPRFALNERYGDIDRFRLAANAVALNVEDVTPSDPLIDAGDENPPAFGFTISGDQALSESLNMLACFTSHEGKLEVSRLGGESGQTRIEVRMKKRLPNGRTRLNCTLPAGKGRWYWFGSQFYTRQ
ncbi:MAG: polysaccharide deacetylase family protein [Rhodospirillales bacterium]|nr:polysaccharide deacetylase family protein [Rhodospirillales bacterium]